MALHDFLKSPSAVEEKVDDPDSASPAQKDKLQVGKKLSHRGTMDVKPVKLASARPAPASSKNLSVAVPVGKRETVKISCGPAEPNSALFREIEINVDEESDMPSMSPEQ